MTRNHSFSSDSDFRVYLLGDFAEQASNNDLSVVKTDMNIGPVSVPRSFHQLGILINDGSPSMTDQTVGGIRKCDAVNDAVRGLLTRFKASRYKKNFSFVVISFAESASLDTPPTVAETIDDNANYDPTVHNGNGTFIGSGLELGGKIASDFFIQEQNEGVPLSVVMVVLSDGMCGDPDRTRDVAQKIKQDSRITICSTLFTQVGARDAELSTAEKLLRDIASDPVKCYKTTYDPETLRQFFIASMSSSSGVRIQ